MKFIIYFISILSLIYGDDLEFKTIQSEFIQVVKSNEAVANYAGKFYASSNNKALWIYEIPSKKMIYFSDNRIMVIEDDLEQVIISKLDNSINLAKILSSAKKISANLYKTIHDEIEYLITTKDNMPYTIDYKDKFENKVRITLKNPIKDSLIPDDIFTPKIPSGYDIINQ